MGDALAFALLDDVRAQFPDSLTKFGRLAEFHAQYAARQGIARYLNSGRRPKALQMARDVGLVLDPAA
ncbi:glutathione S-transferase family protein [Candidatus Binatus sp.]|uniref:glutathione S-transferase family protein n=1 Tax=Candidatus Binatus sp. TaxID=2811406 RepID=UPI003C5ADFF1